MIGLFAYSVVSALIGVISLAFILFRNKTKYKKCFIALGIVGFVIFGVNIVGMFYLSELSVEGLNGEPAEIHLLSLVNGTYLSEDSGYYIGYENDTELKMRKDFGLLSLEECSLYKVEEDCVSRVETYYVIGKRSVFGIDVGEEFKVNYIYLSQPVNVIIH